MKEIIIEGLKPGDILAANVMSARNILVKSGSVITKKLITKLREFGVVSVYIESSEEEEKTAEIIPEKTVKTVKFKIGEYVCRQGDESEFIYILKDGFLDVLVNEEIEDKLTGKKKIKKRKIAEIVGYNINFGEIGAILGVKRTASIKAVTPSEVLMIPVEKNSFVYSMKKHPELGISIAETMALRLKETDEKIRTLSNFTQKLEKTIDYNAKAFYSLVLSLSKVFAENSNEIWIGKLLDFLKSHEHYNYATKIFRKNTLNTIEENNTEKDETVYFISKDIKEYEKEQIICNEGDIGKEIYILVAGRIGVYVGNHRVATISARGSVIGEIAVLTSFKTGQYQKRTATLKAITYTQIVIIEGSQLTQKINEDPGLIAQINISLAQRLPEADSSYINLRNNIIKQLQILSQEELYSKISQTFNSHLSLVEFILKEEYKLIQLLKNKVGIDSQKFKQEFDTL
ncbi:MAG: cyclic nucleotide-binding domain-containing protein [Candidatus Muirbacterium halophilum]|nr:cyclic nucleotide-binding domain-containing protein [Candidatus Muirbacterium halophilum]MCK9475958.1 cyclic nucleotide-binding domain-containing protein [Candidatus Muirbacterium halophilum]